MPDQIPPSPQPIRRYIPPQFTLWQRISRVFYGRVDDFCMIPRRFGLAYHDMRRRKVVVVLWPLNYLVQFAAWVDWHFSNLKLPRKSWIERQAEAGVLRHSKDRALIIDEIENAMFRIDPAGARSHRWNAEGIADAIIRRLRARK